MWQPETIHLLPHNMRSLSFCGYWRRLPTLSQVLRTVKRRIDGGAAGGAYLETKEPGFHDAKGLPLEARAVDALMEAGFKDLLDRHIVLQSFEEPVSSSCLAIRMQKRMWADRFLLQRLWARFRHAGTVSGPLVHFVGSQSLMHRDAAPRLVFLHPRSFTCPDAVS